MIDRSGQWWKGTSPNDVEEYLRSYTEDGHPATRFEHARCSCTSRVFRLDADGTEGCARRTCARCSLQHWICDSHRVAADAALGAVTCPCKADEFEIVGGFSHHQEGTIRWISVGVRCVRCGVLGCPVDWKIDDAPSTQLYGQV